MLVRMLFVLIGNMRSFIYMNILQTARHASGRLPVFCFLSLAPTPLRVLLCYVWTFCRPRVLPAGACPPFRFQDAL